MAVPHGCCHGYQQPSPQVCGICRRAGRYLRRPRNDLPYLSAVTMGVGTGRTPALAMRYLHQPQPSCRHRRRDPAYIESSLAPVSADFCGAHLRRMCLSMKDDVPPDPHRIRIFGSATVMTHAKGFPYSVQQCHASGAGLQSASDGAADARVNHRRQFQQRVVPLLVAARAPPRKRSSGRGRRERRAASR